MKTSLIRLAFTSALLAFVLWLTPQDSMAQNARNAPNTREYSAPQKSSKRSKKDFDPNTTRAKPKTEAQKRKEAREMKKPQYTDASYFGHKKPPKKRPVGKRKYCKECGIWH